MGFKFAEDKAFFERLLCRQGESIEKYLALFDFDGAKLKRDKFNRMRADILSRLFKERGRICELSFPDKCDLGSGFNIDHLIPLSTNKLNKELRGLKAEPGRKVKSQSFGSNNLSNLILTCSKCNGFKKHKILEKEQIQRILGRRF